MRRHCFEIFCYTHANKTHFDKKGFTLSLVLKVRVLEVRKQRTLVTRLALCSKLEMFFHLWFSYTHCSQSYEHRALRDDTLKNGCESSAPCLVIFFYGKCLRVPWINCRCDF